MSEPAASSVIVLCVDGSEVSQRAVAAGVALLQPAVRVAIVTVIDEVDLSLAAGSGASGTMMSAGGLEEFVSDAEKQARGFVEHAARELDLPDAETHVLRGIPGHALCDFAKEVSASALVMGSRGRGGVKRALLGSVSDYVVRNAPCPVVVIGPEVDD